MKTICGHVREENRINALKNRGGYVKRQGGELTVSDNGDFILQIGEDKHQRMIRWLREVFEAHIDSED